MKNYQHLQFSRETTLTDRHRRRGFGNPPNDVKNHAARLKLSLTQACLESAKTNQGGFDDRMLIKVQLRSGQVPSLGDIPGIELVSQEDKTIVLAFLNRTALADFENRLSALARDGKVTRSDLIFALQDFDQWKPEDRQGAAWRVHGFPNIEEGILDIELWPQERHDRRQAMLHAFKNWCTRHHISVLDDMAQPSLVMVRVRCTNFQANEFLFTHRDVRTVDLPPRTGISVQMLHIDVNNLPTISSPNQDAPAIAVLDSGLTTGHPLLKAAVGDAQGYTNPNYQSNDSPPHWHGTFVSGIALYGDIGECLIKKQFIPQLRLFSGKVFEDDSQDQTGFVEKSVEAAVRELNSQYGCRVFNLSYGDQNKVYDGRHVRGLAYTLDRLTRELGVLFVIPTGNIGISELPVTPHRHYPDYLLADECRLIDPAPALNALTVGGLSQHTATRNAMLRGAQQITERQIAQENQPFPMTRCGPSINGAIKPDLVAPAGNLGMSVGTGKLDERGLGVLSTIGDVASGRIIADAIGTSYAAPQVAHRAARLLNEIPDASINMLRALLAAHAQWPAACKVLLNPQSNAEGKERVLRLIGYGQIDDNSLYRSIEQEVTLLAEDLIHNDKCHFYELPTTDSFWSPGRRTREITVALAHSPDVRTTRMDYRMTKLSFRLVQSSDIASVQQAFSRGRDKSESMVEIDGQRRWLSSEDRDKSTLQVSRWQFKQPLQKSQNIYLVVMRQDNLAWSTVADEAEPYALTVVFTDREQTSVNLYAEVQARLAQRVQQRTRARI